MMKSIVVLLVLMAVALQGCAASRQMYYKPEGTQREFDIDSRECEVIAEQQALARSENGKRYNPVDYAERYQYCIATKGWGTKPLTVAGDKQKPALTFSLGTLTGNTLAAFDRQLVLPQGAALLSTRKQTFGPTRLESFLFKGGDFFLNITLQDSEEAAFQKIPYPVADPFQLYTSKGRDDLQWAAFWGKTGDDWVEGIGSFLRFSRHARAVIVITSVLPPPSASPPEGLHLAANQQLAMQNFLAQWQPWLEKQSRPESLAWRTLRTTLGLFKAF